MSALDDLVAALVGIPRLDGARCVGLAEEFDEYEDPEVVEYTLQQCKSCPALPACQQWFDSLRPGQRPHGVVAGRLHKPPRHRNRKQAIA